MRSMASLPKPERRTVLRKLLAKEPPETHSSILLALETAAHDWELRARPSQLEPPGEWFVWLLQAGRGFGKSRTILENGLRRLQRGQWKSCHVIGRTLHDALDTLVIGTAAAPGLLSLGPPDLRPEHQVQKRRLKYKNGAVVRYFGADEPESLRGPQCDGAVADEVDAWKRTAAAATWSNLELGVRLGSDPRILVGSTPKRARLVSALRKRADVVITRGSTYDNRANLAPQFFDAIVRRYDGTHLGRQEIGGEILDDVEGSFLTHQEVEALTVATAPELVRVVVGVDPSGSTTGDAQGIIVKGKGVDGHGYTLADRTCRLSPEGWGRRAVEAAHEFEADCLVVERNYGGDMCEAVIRGLDPSLRVKSVTASRGKHVRFEPVAMRYEQGMEHHVGPMPELTDELCSFTPEGYEGDESPNRADAAVWASLELFPSKPRISWADLGYGAGAQEGN
jgi:phage terminase large subunit-like protein